MPTASIYYFCMGPFGQKEAQGVLPMLAMKFHKSRMTFAHVVWNGKDLWIPRSDHLLQISIGWDCEDLCSSQDQERAKMVLKQAVRESMPTVEFRMEESPVEEHQSNGIIDVTVREIQKTSKSASIARYISRHPILAFLVEHAGRLMSRYQVGRDGRTTYELHACKPYRRQLVEFGERMYFMPIRLGGARQAKLDSKWQDGSIHWHQGSQ